MALAFICFVPVTYRLESPFILRSDDVTFLTAPFDGHIEEVNVRVGDELKAGDTLILGPGTFYEPTIWIKSVQGSPERPVVIRADVPGPDGRDQER